MQPEVSRLAAILPTYERHEQDLSLLDLRSLVIHLQRPEVVRAEKTRLHELLQASQPNDLEPLIVELTAYKDQLNPEKDEEEIAELTAELSAIDRFVFSQRPILQRAFDLLQVVPPYFATAPSTEVGERLLDSVVSSPPLPHPEAQLFIPFVDIRPAIDRSGTVSVIASEQPMQLPTRTFVSGKHMRSWTDNERLGQDEVEVILEGQQEPLPIGEAWVMVQPNGLVLSVAMYGGSMLAATQIAQGAKATSVLKLNFYPLKYDVVDQQ